MSSQNDLIVKNDTEEEDKPNERNPIIDRFRFGGSEIIPDRELQTAHIHTNRDEPLFVKAGRSVIIDVEIFQNDKDVVIYIDGKVCVLVVPDCVMATNEHFDDMRLDRKQADVLRVTIYHVMDYFGKTFIFKQEEHASIPFTIHGLTKANDPGYLETITNKPHRSLLKRCCPWLYTEVKPMREKNQVFSFDDQSNLRRLKKTEGENKPNDETKPGDPKIIRVTTVPKGPGPKRL